MSVSTQIFEYCKTNPQQKEWLDAVSTLNSPSRNPQGAEPGAKKWLMLPQVQELAEKITAEWRAGEAHHREAATREGKGQLRIETR
jgi:hypothetical protein